MINQSLLINETYNDYKVWIDESVGYVCQQVYFDDNDFKLNVSINFTLGENYFNRNWPLIDQRLASGGWRLAVLLNQLAQNRSSIKFLPDMKTLIIIFCIVFCISILLAIVVCVYKRRHYKKLDILMPD